VTLVRDLLYRRGTEATFARVSSRARAEYDTRPSWFGGVSNVRARATFAGLSNVHCFGGACSALQFGGVSDARRYGGVWNARRFGGVINARLCIFLVPTCTKTIIARVTSRARAECDTRWACATLTDSGA